MGGVQLLAALPRSWTIARPISLVRVMRTGTGLSGALTEATEGFVCVNRL